MGSFSNNPLTETLNSCDHRQNNDDRKPYHVAVAHLIAVADRKVAQASGTDCAGNRRNTDETYKSDERDSSDAGDGLS